MTNTEMIFHIAKFAVPAFIFFGAAYYFTNKWYEIQSQKNKISAQNLKQPQLADNSMKKHFFPLQVDAAQRLVLFLERIAPNNLIMRELNPGLPARAFQQKLLNAIRSEYEHNLAQQIFVSSEAWLRVTQSKEEIVKIINMAATKLEPTSLAGELSQGIFEITAQLQQQPTDVAIEFVKQEMRKGLS
jgi:hypothetical protein